MLSNLWQELASQVTVLTGWEAVAVVLAIVYLICAMRRSLWCWPAAFISTLVYTVLFWHVSLLMESLLNIYYMGMALYGFWLWRFGGSRHDGLELQSWPLHKHIKLLVVTTIASLVTGWFMDNYSEASFPYLDAATTCFAIVTTVLVARKVVENWIYWVVIDLVSIYLYMNKGLILTSALFVLYVFLAARGYWLWREKYLSTKPLNTELATV